LTSAVVLTYVYQDKIIQLFIEEANKHIKTPVQVAKIKFSILENFPHVSIILEDISIQESLPGSKATLAKARNVFFTFNLIEIIKGKYSIRQIHIEDGQAFLKITQQGVNNFTIIEKPDHTEENSLSFDVDVIKLKGFFISFKDDKNNQYYTLTAENALGKLLSTEGKYDFGLEGNFIAHEVNVQKENYVKEKAFGLESTFSYIPLSSRLEVNTTKVNLNNTLFVLSGYFQDGKKPFIDLKFESEKTNFSSLVALLPAQYYKQLHIYKSKGEVYFNGQLTGEVNKNKMPGLQLGFGCNNTSFYHPDYKKNIEKVNLTGQLKLLSINNLSSLRVDLKNIKGELEGKAFSGNLTLSNLNDPYIECSVNAELDIASALAFHPVKEIKEAQGELSIDLKFAGKINDLKKTTTTNKVKTSGEVSVSKLFATLNENNLPLKNLNGNFLFNNNDVAISDFSGMVGSSHFLVNGFFKNVLTFLLFPDQPISIEADLISNYLDIDELLSGKVIEKPVTSTGSLAPKEPEYLLELSPKLLLDFNCKIKKIKFRHFTGHHLQGNLKVKDQVATSDKMKANALGGKVSISATLDASVKNYIRVNTDGVFEKISLDSIFIVFENFNQKFLTHQNLKGQVTAEGTSYLVFNQNLKLYDHMLKADADISIKSGELNNFEPLIKLSKFIKSEDLSHLKFSELKNHIHIQNKIIYVPEMEVRSNVNTLFIKGTHNFDQEIDYKLRIPLKELIKKKKDKDEAYGEVEEADHGTTNLLLTLKGTTSDYKIGYDTEAVKEKIISDIKKEGKELKQIFQKKNKETKKEKELNEEEYFDF
jgi:uncharacterized protein involved in outer membrane biogenesis